MIDAVPTYDELKRLRDAAGDVRQLLNFLHDKGCDCPRHQYLRFLILNSESLLDQERAHADRLAEAFKAVMEGFNDETWVRTTANDHDPMWGIKLMPRLAELSKAMELISEHAELRRKS